jgi:hypothetical protein
MGDGPGDGADVGDPRQALYDLLAGFACVGLWDLEAR